LPAVGQDGWAAQSLPADVGFEPHAALRQAVLAAAQGEIRAGGFCMSYQPGDDLEVEDLVYDGMNAMVVLEKKALLFSRQATIGALEVGHAYTGGTAIATVEGGQLREMVRLFGDVQAFEKRGDEVHVIAYLRMSWPDHPGVEQGIWEVIAVTPAGAIRTGLVGLAGVPRRWVEGSLRESHAPGFSTFGLAGTSADPPGGKARARYEVTWTYDPRRKEYVPTTTRK
jgi:hypothetical protein